MVLSACQGTILRCRPTKVDLAKELDNVNLPDSNFRRRMIHGGPCPSVHARPRVRRVRLATDMRPARWTATSRCGSESDSGQIGHMAEAALRSPADDLGRPAPAD